MKHSYLGLPYQTNLETTVHVYPITLQTTPYHEPPNATNSMATSDIAKEF
uniref:Uncharacterized protein n=1 Tax=Arundo donax TaxID=35708 RepID=A0A0A9D178_ARUDO